MNIHIIRHAESEANTKDILAGQLDFPLTKKGTEDAKKIASWYTSHYSPKIIYSSPLLRATQTAAPFRINKDIIYIEDDRLKEHNLGIYQGKTYKEAEADPTYVQDRTKRWDWHITDGESYEDIATRITSFFAELDPHGPDILIVTHAVAMRLIRALLEHTLPIYPQQLAQNGEIWEVEFKKIGETHEITSLFIDEILYDGHRG